MIFERIHPTTTDIKIIMILNLNRDIPTSIYIYIYINQTPVNTTRKDYTSTEHLFFLPFSRFPYSSIQGYIRPTKITCKTKEKIIDRKEE